MFSIINQGDDNGEVGWNVERNKILKRTKRVFR